jgi:hypothetical protein
MDLAGACLVRMMELKPQSRLVTLDSDFLFYRRERRRLIPVVMPD